MCTFERPDDLTRSLDVLADGAPALDRLVIVDNGADCATSTIVTSHRLHDLMPIDVITPGDNLGPAGGYAEAFKTIDRFAEPDDLVVILDDDDPPPTSTILHDVVALADDAVADPKVAGLGLRGGALNLRTGIIAPRPTGSAPIETADHLHGGWLPVYRIGALREADVFDGDLFWGFDDLELGRRLARHGYDLRVASGLFATVSNRRRAPYSTTLPLRSWRHYYRHRNLLRILRRDRAWGAIVATIVGRLILKPLANLPRHPALASWHLRTNAAAVRDGLLNTTANTHPRYRPGVPES